MPLFRCSICGENFPGILVGQNAPVGFYATRFIEAASPEEAEAIALERLRAEPTLDVPAGFRTEDARVLFEAIVEVNPHTERGPESGFSFFIMGS
ncbi:hypothetical protein [Stenotrophomonas sp.]|uniref:hypothetical protein n=1 Tax=Stenotrophomonas sp. TaxID=69392 RepID=UPI0028AB5DAD|nr:hypothetical protein [Stenotrophomonas sp.]